MIGRTVVAALLLTALAPLAAGAASPKPGGTYVGTMVNEDSVTVHVSRDGKSGTAVVSCHDLGEVLTFDPFQIVKGTFNGTVLSATVPKKPNAKLRGTFTSTTQISAFVNEHPTSNNVALGGGGGVACLGISSPATLTLKHAAAH
jgi:hypothetical protein